MTAARHPVVTFLLVGLFVLDVATGTNTKYISICTQVKLLHFARRLYVLN